MQERPIAGEATVDQSAAASAADIGDLAATLVAAADTARHRLPFRGKTRAGYTTNKGHGTSKAKRKMAAASRHRNRGK